MGENLKSCSNKIKDMCVHYYITHKCIKMKVGRMEVAPMEGNLVKMSVVRYSTC